MAYTTVDDPSKYFQSNAYTGNGGTRSIVNDGNSDMQPDWVWIKKRNDAQNHTMTDSSRAVANIIFPDVNDAESATQLLTSFNTDGYSLNNNALANGNSQTYATWQWKANGGTTVTNDASSTSIGSIDSVIQANTDAGFSIITYTGTGSAATVAHGLSAVPHVLIVKKRNAADNWYVYHHENTSDPETDYLVLDTTDATADDTVFGDAVPSTTTFSINNAGTHADGKTFVCYAFTEKQGYSRFGHYIGNAGEPGGPFIYTGFKPAWIMVKASSESGQSWVIGDNVRDFNGNLMLRKLFADNNSAESATAGDNNWDFYSNGFKIKTQDDAMNKNNVTYVYMAFAHRPFVTSTGVPTVGSR